MTETPRIRIDKIEDIRILICLLIYSLGCPLTREQIIEITSFEDAVNYFDVTAALDGIERLCSAEEVNGTPVYSNTPLGIKAAKECESVIPVSVREKMYAETVRIYTRDASKAESPLTVRYAKKSDGTCTVGISARDTESGKQKFYFSLVTSDESQAERIKKRLTAAPESFIAHVEGFFS